MLDDAIARDLPEPAANCWVDAVDERLDLTIDVSLSEADRRFVFSSLFDCAELYADLPAMFSDCIAEWYAKRKDGLSVARVVNDSGSLMNDSNKEVWRAGVVCGNPEFDAKTIDCIVEGLEDKYPEVWTHPMRSEEQAFATTLVDACIAGR